MRRPIKCLDTLKNEEVTCGSYEAGIFYKRVKLSHYVHIFKGYGISEEAMKAIEMCCHTICIEAGALSRTCSVKDWKDYNLLKRLNEKQELQYFYPWDKMKGIDNASKETLDTEIAG